MPYEHVANIVFIKFKIIPLRVHLMVKEYACKVYWLFTLNLPQLINMKLLPIIFIHYSAKRH